MERQRLWGSTSTTAVTPAFDIAGAAAASSCATRAATRRGSSVFETSCARCLPRRRRSGAGPSASAPRPAFSSSSNAAGPGSSGPGRDHAHEVAEGRVAELAPPRQLVGQEARHVVVGGQRERPGVRLEGLDEHAARCVAPTPPSQLRDELERPLLRAEIGQAETGVGVHDGGQLDPGEVVALGDHLRSEQHRTVGLAEAPQRSGQLLGIRGRVRVEPDQLELGTLAASSRSSRCVPAPIRAISVERQTGHSSGSGSTWPQWWQCSRSSRCSTSATSQSGQRKVVPQARQWSAGAIPRRLSKRIALPPLSAIRAELGEQRRRERVAGLAAQVDETDRRQLGAEPLAQLEPLEPLPALRPRRRAAVERDSPFERSPLGRDRARVVARIGLLLVRRVVLLVDADQADAVHRREDRRARADDDTRLAGRDPFALVAALCVGQPRVQDRDRVAETRAEAADASAAPGRSRGRARSSPSPRSSAAAAAWRYTSVLPLPVGP